MLIFRLLVWFEEKTLRAARRWLDVEECMLE